VDLNVCKEGRLKEEGGKRVAEGAKKSLSRTLIGRNGKIIFKRTVYRRPKFIY